MSTRALNSSELIELYDRKTRVIARRPAFAHVTGQSCIHLTDGFACDVHDEERMTRVDQPESDGGAGTGPHPGQLMRASLGASMAIGYRLWAARLGIPIDTVDVELTCEYDARGQLGLDPEIAVGWRRLLVQVAIVSTAPSEDVRRVVETADRLNPMLANLSSSIERSHRLTVSEPRVRSADAAKLRNVF